MHTIEFEYIYLQIKEFPYVGVVRGASWLAVWFQKDYYFTSSSIIYRSIPKL